MAKKLKYKKFDEFGDLIIERSQNWYIVEIQTGKDKGKQVKRWKPGKTPTKPRGMTARQNFLNNPKRGSNGFDKRPQDTKKGNAGNQIVNAKKKMADEGTLWQVSQRECLRQLLEMPFAKACAYFVQWGMGGADDALRLYGVDVADALGTIDKTPPTTVQILSLRMVLRAREDAKLAMNIMEMIEGKAVAQTVIEEAKKEKEKEEQTASQKENPETGSPVKPLSEMEEMMEQLKAIAFSTEVYETPVDYEPERPETDLEVEEPVVPAGLEGLDLLDYFSTGGD